PAGIDRVEVQVGGDQRARDRRAGGGLERLAIVVDRVRLHEELDDRGEVGDAVVRAPQRQRGTGGEGARGAKQVDGVAAGGVVGVLVRVIDVHDVLHAAHRDSGAMILLRHQRVVARTVDYLVGYRLID